jgi:hypothetical protein
MKITTGISPVLLAILFSGCSVGPSKNDNAALDAVSAIRIGVDACISKNVVQPSLLAMHAEFRGGKWHVWEQGRLRSDFYRY